MNIVTAINALFLTTVLFISLFVGNAKVNDLYLFYIIIIFVYGLMLFYQNKKVFIPIDIFNLFILGVFFIQNLYSSEFMEYENYEYYFWPLNAMILYLLFIFYTIELNNKFFVKISLFLFILFFYLLLLPSIVDLLTINTPRYSFIFGPNMYYRVLSIIVIIVLYLMQRKGNPSNFIIIVFFLIPYVFGILHTGSRGALFTLLMVFIFYVAAFIQLKKSIVFLSLLFFLIIGSMLLLMVDINFDSRIFLVDYKEGSSIGIRLSAYFYLFEHFFDLVFSLGMTQYEFENLLGGIHFHYPHNLFLELVYYYGFFGMISVLFIHGALLVILKKYMFLKENHYLYIVYIIWILLLSASFSGDFSDNYPFISLSLFLLREIFSKRINDPDPRVRSMKLI